MSKVKRKILILLTVFLLAFTIGMIGAPEETPAGEEGSEVSAASLPVLCAEYEGELINPLVGYTEEMDAACLADSVYPFSDIFAMTVKLVDGVTVPKSVSYEVRDEAGGRLIERGSADAFNGGRSECSFSFTLKDLYDDNTYYRLRFAVELNDRTAYYYTRIRKVSAETLKALTDYALAFHNAMFDKEAAAAYAAKFEPDGKSDSGTLAYVDIHCPMEQVCWGNVGAEAASRPWMTVQAVQGDYGYFRFDYLVSAPSGGAAPVTLRCRETMTLQKSKTSMYLLRYERRAAQLWEANEDTVSEKGFLLGVQEEGSLQAVTGSDTTVFSLGGELYRWSAKEQKLTRLFSFRRKGEHEVRSIFSDCDVRIMSVAADGTVDFAVSGYMSGGSREGMCGAVYYSYKPDEGILQENMAIASDKSPEMVKRDTKTLFARGGDHFLYFCLDRQIIAMDVSSGESAVLVSRNEYDSLIMSESGTAFAWQSGSDQQFPGSLHVMDLEKGTNETVPAQEGGYIRTLGYIREDLIVGRGRKDDTPLDDGAGGLYLLKSLEILDEDLGSIMTYDFPDIYVSGIEKDSEKITVHRYAKTEDGYAARQDDILLRSDSETGAQDRTVTTYRHETLKRSLMIRMSKLPSFLRLTSESVPALKEGRLLSVPDTETGAGTGCYAYGRGSFLGSFDAAGKAVAAASPDYGYVIDAGTGKLIWAWTSRRQKAEISPGAVRTDLPQTLDLRGISFRNLLYFLDRGIPVRLIDETGERWITGYGKEKVSVYDPVTREVTQTEQQVIEALLLRNDIFLWAYTD